jgi:hypothetical protein
MREEDPTHPPRKDSIVKRVVAALFLPGLTAEAQNASTALDQASLVTEPFKD